MATYRLSARAEADLIDIGDYTLNNWGADQALRYLNALEACCESLVARPEMGRACEHVRPGLRRMECGRHVVFYRIESGGIMVSRILHQRMLAKRHSIEE
jgi:toxin ParE1/3/4